MLVMIDSSSLPYKVKVRQKLFHHLFTSVEITFHKMLSSYTLPAWPTGRTYDSQPEDLGLNPAQIVEKTLKMKSADLWLPSQQKSFSTGILILDIVAGTQSAPHWHSGCMTLRV